MKNYRWRRIEDLPENWRELAAPELPALSAAWQKYSEKLRYSDSLKHFNERLIREWAIETGIIENLYSIDRGVTQTLIEKGIEASLIPHGSTDKPVERILPMLKDQQEVVEGLFDFVAQRRELSSSYIKQLHQAFTRHQETTPAVDSLGRSGKVDLLRGEWKRLPNNPTRPDGGVHEFCPPEHVASEMDHLIAMHQEHQQIGVSPEIESAWLHHRFAQIHPFQDGNGRVARALASLVFLRAGWFPLVVNRDGKVEYIESLEKSDQGDFASLVNLFARIQKKAFNQALSLSDQIILEGDPLQELIKAATNRLKERKQKRFEQVALAEQLLAFTQVKLEEISAKLNRELSETDQNYGAYVEKDKGDNASAFNQQASDIANQLGYHADIRTYAAWVYLGIREEKLAEIIFSFHATGTTFLGLMAVLAFAEYQSWQKTGERATSGPYPLCSEPFQFSIQDNEEQTVKRFQNWMNDSLLAGLDHWRKQI
jgi:Fic family protein